MSSIPPILVLASGLRVRDPEGTLRRFCAEEYEFYDGIVGGHPDIVEPIYVLSTICVNSNLDKNNYLRSNTVAEKVRYLTREMNRCCSTHIVGIPQNADILADDPSFSAFERLIRAANSITGVANAVATKILYRKRRNFIPMLDSFVVKHYAAAEADEISRAMVSIRRFREDLLQSLDVIAELQVRMRGLGFNLEFVRLLEILIWTELVNLYKR